MKIKDFLYYRSLNSGNSGGGGGGGGSDVLENDVMFYDYDGTPVASYSKEQFASLAALPANPSHAGMVSQGWNWSLADAKAAVADFGFLDIGQIYTTETGATEIDIELFSRLEPWTRIAVNGTATIDWGDGSTATTVTGTSSSSYQNIQHIYPAPGKYTIKVTVVGEAGLAATSTGSNILWDKDSTYLSYTYRNSIKAIRFGENIKLNAEQCRELCNLEYVTIPKGVTSIPADFAMGAWCLRYINIPDTVTTISSSAFSSNKTVSCSIPKTAAVGSSAFYDGGIRRAVVYSISSTAQFSMCKIFERLGINTAVPKNLCQDATSLKSVVIKAATSIENSAFQRCYALTYVEIPETVTSIGTSAFGSCYSMKEFHFKGSTPPTLGNANAFSNVPTDCKIYVPTGSLTAYTTAENYPDSATYTYIEE